MGGQWICGALKRLRPVKARCLVCSDTFEEPARLPARMNMDNLTNVAHWEGTGSGALVRASIGDECGAFLENGGKDMASAVPRKTGWRKSVLRQRKGTVA
jgi:hypothetical protein